MSALLGIFFFILLILLVWGLIAPHHLSRTARFKKTRTRKHFSLTFGFLAVLILVLAGLITPSAPAKPSAIKSTSASSQTQQQRPVITTKMSTSTQSIAFTTQTTKDSNLAQGKIITSQIGINGVETFTYKTTYTDGKQTNRQLISQVVTTQPTPQIVEDGTYVAPSAPSPTPVATPTPTSSPSAPSTCYPLSDEGTCYEPGEYCRDSDQGTSGIAGDGESITCLDNDGWRWESS
jgi:hypothetical protein